MAEVTRIYTARITYIENDSHASSEEQKEKLMEDAKETMKVLLNADDVMIDNIQEFVLDK